PARARRAAREPDRATRSGVGPVERVRTVLPVRLLPGARVPRDGAVGARTPMGRAERNLPREPALYLRSAALELLCFARLTRRTHVRCHLCDRAVLRRPVQAV